MTAKDVALEAKGRRITAKEAAPETKGPRITAEGIASEAKGRRITVDLNLSATVELDRLKKATGLTTSELFRHAFNLLRVYIRAKRGGGDLCTGKQGKVERIIELPFVVSESEGG